MRLSSETRRRGDVTLVALRVANETATPRRVRVANRLDGPVWYPRRNGLPVAGWDGGGFEGVLGVGETRALGYASPAPPTDPPADIAWSERAADTDTTPTDELTATDDVTTVVAELGDPRPPRDAVAVPAQTEPTGPPGADAAPGDSAGTDEVLPDAVRTWLDELADRVEAAGPLPAERRQIEAELSTVADRIEALRARHDGRRGP